MAKCGMTFSVLGLLLCLSAAPALQAADDESDDTQFEIKGPLQAVNCAAAPPTVTVLGITFAIPANSLDDSNSRRKGDDDGSDDDSVNCSALAVGQMIEIRFSSAAPPLTPSSIDTTGSDEAKIQGRIEAIDPSAQTITVLGLVIQTAGARLDGSDDRDNNSSDDNSNDAPLTFSQLAVGQFVEIRPNLAALPALVATEVEVRNFNNQLTLRFEDRDNNVANDDDSIDVVIEQTLRVRESVSGGRTKRIKKVFTYTYSASGMLTITGLPSGAVKVTATRTTDNVTAQKNVRVKGGQASIVTLTFKAPRTRVLEF